MLFHLAGCWKIPVLRVHKLPSFVTSYCVFHLHHDQQQNNIFKKPSPSSLFVVRCSLFRANRTSLLEQSNELATTSLFWLFFLSTIMFYFADSNERDDSCVFGWRESDRSVFLNMEDPNRIFNIPVESLGNCLHSLDWLQTIRSRFTSFKTPRYWTCNRIEKLVVRHRQPSKIF